MRRFSQPCSLLLLSFWPWVVGCSVESPCPGSVEDGEPAGSAAAVYVSSGDPYQAGGLSVAMIDVARCQEGAPRPMHLYAPRESGMYAVVVFQHGFLLSVDYYSEVLSHLASHGFIVVAPQMYPADGIPLGKPDAIEEARRALEVLEWLPGRLSRLTGVEAAPQVVGLAGHSRGGKVIWRVATEAPERVRALAGVDPTDGTLDGSPRVTGLPLPANLPVLVIGAGLGGVPASPGGLACAPEGDNHVPFYAASPSPAWHVVAVEQGHLDVLDDDRPGCGLVCGVCAVSGNPAEMRRLTAGMLTAFFRGSLQGDSRAFAFLVDADASPTPIVVETK